MILNEEGTEVFSRTPGFDTEEGEVSAAAMEVLTDLLGGDELLVPNSTFRDTQVRLFGLRIRDRLRIMAMDALRFYTTNNTTVALPVGLWYHRPFEPAPWCDPYEAAIPSEQRNDVPYDGLAEFLGIDVPPGADVDTDPRLQAELARQLALRCHLFPV